MTSSSMSLNDTLAWAGAAGGAARAERRASRRMASRVEGMHRHTAGSLLIAGCALSWGVIAVVVREIHLPAMTIVCARCALSALLIGGALALVRRDLLRRPPPAVFVLGVMLAGHWSLYFAA